MPEPENPIEIELSDEDAALEEVIAAVAKLDRSIRERFHLCLLSFPKPTKRTALLVANQYARDIQDFLNLNGITLPREVIQIAVKSGIDQLRQKVFETIASRSAATVPLARPANVPRGITDATLQFLNSIQGSQVSTLVDIFRRNPGSTEDVRNALRDTLTKFFAKITTPAVLDNLVALSEMVFHYLTTKEWKYPELRHHDPSAEKKPRNRSK